MQKMRDLAEDMIISGRKEGKPMVLIVAEKEKLPEHFENYLTQNECLVFDTEKKGLSKEDMGILLEKMFLKEETEGQKLLEVSCFGTFRVKIIRSDREISWRTKKSMELFAYLISLEGKPVERRALLKLLWGDDAPDNAVAMLHNMIYSIRKELSEEPELESLIQYKNHQYFMDMSRIKCNLFEIKEICKWAEQGKTELLLDKKDCFTQFWGTYLEEIDSMWCMSQRVYFERSFGKVCRLLAEHYKLQEDYETEERFWNAYLEADCYSEDALAGLLDCYARMGAYGRIKQLYESARRMFKEELGIDLNPELIKTYEQGIGKNE